MSEQTSCIRCGRAIDAWAKICPFCNWDQAAQLPAQPPLPPLAVTEYVPPSEYNLKKKAIFAGAGVLALVAAFGIGVVINKDDAPNTAPETIEQQIAEDRARAGAPRRADTPLVPMNEPGGIDQPITSAPVAGQPGEALTERSDATAVSATEYAEMARRAQDEKARMAVLVDPRSLTGPAYRQPASSARPQPPAPPQTAMPMPPPETPASAQTESPRTAAPESAPPQPAAPAAPARRASMRTRPVPQYQPLPRISASGTARLSLIIGPDGRVTQVDVEQALTRNTSQLIAAVQQWRFKPATENGEPISAPYSVEISFRQ